MDGNPLADQAPRLCLDPVTGDSSSLKDIILLTYYIPVLMTINIIKASTENAPD